MRFKAAALVDGVPAPTVAADASARFKLPDDRGPSEQVVGDRVGEPASACVAAGQSDPSQPRDAALPTSLLQAMERLHILGAALDQSREMVIVSTADKDPATGCRRIVYVNEALLAGTRYARDEVLARSPSMFQGPDTDPHVLARISARLAAGQSVAETLRNYKKDGTPHWLDLRIHPLTDGDGRTTHFVSVQRDVTEQLESLAQLKRQNAFLTRLTGLLPGAVYVYRRSAAGKYFFDYTTAAFQALFGVVNQPPKQVEVLAALHPDDLPSLVEAIERSARTQSRWRQRFRARRTQDSGYRILEGLSDPIAEPDGTVLWFGIIFDVTEQVEVELALNESLIEHQATLEAVPEQLIELDAQGTMVRAHVRGDQVLGRPLSGLLHRRMSDVLPDEIALPFARAVAEAQRNGVSSAHEIAFQFQGRCEYRSLTVVRMHLTTQQLTTATGASLIASLSDITDRKLAEERVRQLVNHDELTELLNRRGFHERLQLVHDQARRHGSAYALMFIDLDHFKHLNDSLGHEAGDLALKQTAARLSANTRATDMVARLGGDEFVVLVAGPDAERLAEEAMVLATKLVGALSAQLDLAGQPFNLTCSIGIALSDASNRNSQDIVRWADLAMYSVKESGRNGIKFFDDRIQQRILHRVQLEQDLRAALATGAFSLSGQPIVDELARTLGFELLLRWSRPGVGPVSPAEFIPVAEHSGLVVPMGQWVLEQACQMLESWAGQPERAHLFVAVNVSAIQIKQTDFVERLSRTLAQSGAPARRLKLELTESLLHEDVEGTIHKLHQLRGLGVQLSLDDFGTGYSSLAYLRRLPIHELKIDRSFVLHALDQSDDAAVARMIVQLAQTLRLDVVAEGVETAEQLTFLRDIGCRRFQGYMFGRPEPM